MHRPWSKQCNFEGEVCEGLVYGAVKSLSFHLPKSNKTGYIKFHCGKEYPSKGCTCIDRAQKKLITFSNLIPSTLFIESLPHIITSSK